MEYPSPHILRYRPRSRGDNAFGSVHPSVWLARSGRYWYLALPSTAKGPVKHKLATLLKNFIECASQGVFKMVGHSKWLFRQVAPLQSIMLLILAAIWLLCFFAGNERVGGTKPEAQRASETARDWKAKNERCFAEPCPLFQTYIEAFVANVLDWTIRCVN